MVYSTIVVGVDGSQSASNAVTSAIAVASEGATIHVVTGVKTPSLSETKRILASLPEEFLDRIDPYGGLAEHLERAANRVKDSGLNVESHLVEEPPTAAILATADKTKADLIVVGSRGSGLGRGFLRGSVATRVAVHARTSFLVVHAALDAD